jgi:hypothetical protein
MNNTVAKTIFSQLGGSRFTSMTGASKFVSTENGVEFHIPNAAKKITRVRIELTPQDTYTMQFLNCRMVKNGMKREIVSEHTDVYCENLEDIFTRETKLYTHF